MDMNYTFKEAIAPSQLTKKTFKFGHSKVWITTWMRDDYKREEWGKVSESSVSLYIATMIINNLKKEGWSII